MTNTAEALARVHLRVENPELIPAERYYDPEFFELEKKHLWPHVWQMACRLQEIPNVGDFMEYTILDKSVIVINTRNGIKAFHNACRHRGVRLATGPGNCAKTGFICPFHGWRWNMEGENTFVFGKQIFNEELLAHAEIDLPPVRLELWAGCAFINFDDDAPGLRESLGPIAAKVDARHGDQLKMDWWYSTILPANWKIALEAFLEGYHVMRTHPQMHEIMPMAYGPDIEGRTPPRNWDSHETVNRMIDYHLCVSEGMAGMIHPTERPMLEQLRDMELPNDPLEALQAFHQRLREKIAADGLARGAPMFDVAKVCKEQPLMAVEYVFPNFFLLPVFSAMSSYRVRPLTPETCYFELWSLALYPDGEEPEAPRQPTFLPYDSPDYPLIPMQDYSNIPLQQLGLHAGNFTHMRLSREKEGTISNYHRLIDGYIAGLAPEKLATASATVNLGFECPIRDIGF